MTGGIDVPNNVSYNQVYMSNGTLWWSGPPMNEVLYCSESNKSVRDSMNFVQARAYHACGIATFDGVSYAVVAGGMSGPTSGGSATAEVVDLAKMDALTLSKSKFLNLFKPF